MTTAARPLAMERGLLRGLGIVRWLSWVWVLGVAIYAEHRGDLDHPLLAFAVIAVAFVFAAFATLYANRDTHRALRVPLVAADLAVAVALYLVDGIAFRSDHVLSPGQSLVASWPLMSVASAGIAFGPFAGLAGGVLMGLSRFVSALLNGRTDIDDWTVARSTSVANTLVFISAWGAVAGWTARQLRRAENEVASVRAREDFARTMHDSVLQTLSLVERRTRLSDPELADTARRTDRELRTYLFGGAVEDDRDLVGAIRRVIDSFISEGLLEVQLSVVEPIDDDARAVTPESVRALRGAVREALNNVIKHSGVNAAVVFVDVESDHGGPFVSIRDAGIGSDLGFAVVDLVDASALDQSVAPGSTGLRGSIGARFKEVGGRAEIETSPGKGTEVRLWVPPPEAKQREGSR